MFDIAHAGRDGYPRDPQEQEEQNARHPRECLGRVPGYRLLECLNSVGDRLNTGHGRATRREGSQEQEEG